MDFQADKYLSVVDHVFYNSFGKVSKVVGLTVESIGPDAKLKDLCRIVVDREKEQYVRAEVVGFKDNRLLLMPFESVEGIGVGSIVENTYCDQFQDFLYPLLFQILIHNLLILKLLLVLY